MLFCCNKEFGATYSFYTQEENYITKRIEFGYCPHCKKPIYNEFKIDFKDNIINKRLKGHEAERAFSKAMFNRLVFISKLEQGTRARQYWCYGDYKKSNKRDKKGNLIHIQIKRNFNGQEIENLGLSEIIYK